MVEEGPRAEEVIYTALDDLGHKLDTVAGAIATVAKGHTDLLGHLAGSEARRIHDAADVSQRLEALERQVLQLGHREGTVDLTPIRDQVAAAATRHDQDLALSLEVLARLAEAFDGLNARAAQPPDVRPLLQRIDQVTESLPVLASEVTEHTDLAVVGLLRLVDQRLAVLRADMTSLAATMGGFEAGAVMGATQTAWTRLEQRLDVEFDDLGRQLQGLASLIADVITATEGLANRPMVTGDQVRKAASAVRDSVVSANRSRRERRGGPRELDPG